MVPTAWAIQLAGHEVRVAVAPDFAACGLSVSPVGPSPPPGLIQPAAPPSDPSARPGPRLVQATTWFAAVAAGMADGVVDLCRDWEPDLLVHDPLALAAPLVGSRLGIRIRYLPYNGGGLAPEWLRRPAAGPRVCITPGTVADATRELRWLRELVERFAAAQVEVGHCCIGEVRHRGHRSVMIESCVDVVSVRWLRHRSSLGSGSLPR
ncbi:hypothetical protein ThrDRAFT_04659 [Frankia casuarinae]|nr:MULTISPECIES: nucleotide disphospho-sugar-binding domain-containing protein [Frankia]EYT89717.1 hypothetical protein ThrDRAFT_04659 [Frankia casuarinae]